MSKYDGWTIKSPEGYFYNFYFRLIRTETIEAFEKNMMEPYSWRKYRRRGWKLVRVKLIEVE